MSRQPAHSMSRDSSVRQTSFTSGPLRVDLTLSPQGRVLAKRESVAGRVHDWAYAYDGQGRLSRAELNGRVVEEYAYGPRGERIADSSAALRAGRRELRYDRSGQLVLAGRMRLRYDRAGRLAAMETLRGATHLVYGDSGGLEAAHLANGLVLEYATDGMGRPLEKRIGGRVVERFHWLDKVRLGFWEDMDQGRLLEFVYGRGRVPRAARLVQGGHAVELVLGADQVGTVKAVATSDGHLIQHITYDSFGNMLDLQGEDLGLPIGFSGGIRYRHLGLVRFGHRDYDPAIGRFTAPDPLGDTGGDHDLWEYCVDDPVSRIDPQGLDDGNWLGEMFSNAWQSVKDWWDKSPEPNQKDAIVGTADAAAELSKQAGEVVNTLQKTGMTTADKVSDVLNSPGVKNAGKAVGAVAKGAAGIGIINNAATVVDAFQEVAPRDADLSAIMKRVNAGTMTNEDLLELENRNWGAPIFKGASAAGKAGVSLMTPP